MIRFASIDTHGLVIGLTSGHDRAEVEAEALAEADGGQAVEVPEGAAVRAGEAAWNGTTFIDVGAAPSVHHVWRGSWVDGRTAAQIAAAAWTALRAERNAKLTACDWTQVPDSPMTALQRTCWAQYRQALRNMPETTTDPNNPTWPQEPN